jgi:hypothetical protein
MSWNDPYRGRQHQARRVKEILRESTRQPGGELPKAAKGGIGDVSDGYLTGKAGGEAHPYFDKPRTSRR